MGLKLIAGVERQLQTFGQLAIVPVFHFKETA